MSKAGIDRLLDLIRSKYPDHHNLIMNYSGPVGPLLVEKGILTESQGEALRVSSPEAFLTEEQTRLLQDTVEESHYSKKYLSFRNIIDSNEDEQIASGFARKMYESLDEGLKEVFQESDLAYQLREMPVMNLGVIKNLAPDVPSFIQDFAQKSSDAIASDELIAKILVRHYVKKGEAEYNGNIGSLPDDLRAEMGESSLEKLVVEPIQNLIDYSQELNSQSDLDLFFHQTNRLYEMVENGSRRVLCADATGAGKTLVGVTKKLLEDQKRGTKGRALIFAPGQTMRSVWGQEEVDKYVANLKGADSQDVTVIEKYDDFQDITEKGFVVINYDKLGLDKNYTRNRYWKKIMELSGDSDLLIFDEAHRLKNYKTNSAKAFAEIVDKTKDIDSLFLTATPVPNKLSDLGFLFYMLNPDDPRFACYRSEPYQYSLDPNAIRDVMVRKQWFDISKDAINKLFSLPTLTESDSIDDLLHVELNEEEESKYFEAWKPSAFAGTKLYQLRKVLMDSKVRQIESIVSDVSNDDQQVIIYTPLKKDVVNNIKQNLGGVYDPRSICTIDGDDSFKRKQELAHKFRQGKYQVLICTDVLNEGISLACGDKEIDMYIMEPQITPAEYIQLIGRAHRIGQNAPVRINTLVSHSDNLQDLMTREVMDLEEKYNVSFRSTWTPTTIDLDRYKIRHSKDLIIQEALRRALPLDEHTLELLDEDGESGSSRETHSSLISKKETGSDYFGKHINRLSQLKGKKYDPSKLGLLVTDYRNVDSWAVSTAAESNRIVASFLEALDKNSVSTERIVDLGSGPACLARVLHEYGMQRYVDCVDGMQAMLDLGAEVVATEGVQGVRFFNRQAWDTGLIPGYYDVAACCNALHYNNQNTDRDVERIIMESNRLLSTNGYAAFTLIPKTDPQYVDNVAKLFERYSFNVTFADEVSLSLENANGKKKNSQIPMIFGQKKADYLGDVIGDAVEVYTPFEHVATGGTKPLKIFTPQKEKQVQGFDTVSRSYSTKEGSIAEVVNGWD
ncbi:MAG: helicase-related protein [Candidatus Woesearchaeota archaeon]